MKVCAVEKFGGRGGGRRPTVGTDLSTGIAGHSESRTMAVADDRNR
jgi:hypothetical protein